MDPVVTFVVPCYNLAHLLPECVDSILGQTFENFEVLIMDDCSPDDTAEVAKSFTDPRVIHVRNQPNLGHLRNYNKGIQMARGEYVWLISADDRLRRPYVLQRYLDVMARNPRIGFACCSGMEFRDGEDVAVAKYSVQADQDTVFRGHEFLRRLLRSNCVLAASGMVRKQCYEAHGAFPLDLPYAGDWYLWSLFSLFYDVAYFAEPMVSYRQHPGSMTSELMASRVRACIADDLAVLWRILRHADRANAGKIAETCREAVALEYAYHLAGRKYPAANASITEEEFHESLAHYVSSDAEAKWMRARAYAHIAEFCYRGGDMARCRNYYDRALGEDPNMTRIRVKRALLRTGRLGIRLRQHLFDLRTGELSRS